MEKIEVSSGQDPKNIVDWNDQGQGTYWNSSPSAKENREWVVFDMGQPQPVCRFWMLSNPQGDWGWLTDFVWQSSADGRSWTEIPRTNRQGNDTHRNIVDFAPVNARYYRLVITGHQGLQAQLNVVIPYVQGKPTPPRVPDDQYVLLIGNQMNGFTYTRLAEFVKEQGFQTVTVSHDLVSWELLQALQPQPMAIICSGNNANYPDLPMFEYNGEYEMRRVRISYRHAVYSSHAKQDAHALRGAISWQSPSGLYE